MLSEQAKDFRKHRAVQVEHHKSGAGVGRQEIDNGGETVSAAYYRQTAADLKSVSGVGFGSDIRRTTFACARRCCRCWDTGTIGRAKSKFGAIVRKLE